LGYGDNEVVPGRSGQRRYAFPASMAGNYRRMLDDMDIN
jgi:hypothetical protein